VRAIPPTSP